MGLLAQKVRLELEEFLDKSVNRDIKVTLEQLDKSGQKEILEYIGPNGDIRFRSARIDRQEGRQPVLKGVSRPIRPNPNGDTETVVRPMGPNGDTKAAGDPEYGEWDDDWYQDWSKN